MTAHLLLSLPIAVPLLTLVICAVLWRHAQAQRLASLDVPAGLARLDYAPNAALDWLVFRAAAAITATSRWAADRLPSTSGDTGCPWSAGWWASAATRRWPRSPRSGSPTTSGAGRSEGSVPTSAPDGRPAS